MTKPTMTYGVINTFRSAALSASVAPVLLVSYPSAPSQPIILGGFVIGVLLALSHSAAWLDANMRVF